MFNHFLATLLFYFSISILDRNWSERSACAALGINEGGHYFGPSGAVQTVSDSHRPLFCIFLVRAALCRRCLTAVGHYFAYFWSERRCADGV